MWNCGYCYEEMCIYLDGYLVFLRIFKVIELFLINRLEEEMICYMYDFLNFEI